MALDTVPVEAPGFLARLGERCSALCLSAQELHFFLTPIPLYSYAEASEFSLWTSIN